MTARKSQKSASAGLLTRGEVMVRRRLTADTLAFALLTRHARRSDFRTGRSRSGAPVHPGSVHRAPFAARQAFADLDPSGALAASWLTATAAPAGWSYGATSTRTSPSMAAWRVVLALARLDGTRYANASPSP